MHPAGSATHSGLTTRSALFAGAAAAFLSVCALTGLHASMREAPHTAMLAHAWLFATGLLLWLAALQSSLRHAGLLLLGIALLARLVLLPFPASDDVNRYLWEGRLVLAGESPYAAPAATAPDAWRDDVWAGMNNKDKPTVYPPLAQLVFAGAVAIAYHPLPMKVLFVAAEMLLLLLLLAELRRRRLPEAHLALAACNPVLLLSTAAEGHYDALFVLPMLAALLFRARGRDGWAWAALGLAVQLKIVALLLVPLLLRRGGWRAGWAFGLAVLLPALPFAGHLPDLARAVFSFASGGYHGGFVHALLRGPLGADTASLVCLALLAAWAGLVLRRTLDPLRGGFLLLSALLLLSPITHYWYFGWIVPFLVLAPQPAWLLLTGTQFVYAAAWASLAATGRWGQPDWAWWVEWLPFALLLAATAEPSARRLLDLRRPFAQRYPAPVSVSTIVPVYREAARIGACVQALLASGPELVEVIVVDANSDDGTAERARGAGARVLSAPLGRGRQIATGVAAARGCVVWIVHADVLAVPGTPAVILGALGAAPAAAGGAVGQRFDAERPALLTIEALNAVRSALFGLSFGDQGQFLRRAALPDLRGYPDLPLMEDVELALRLRRVGPVLHLGRNGIVSSRRWSAAPPLRRALTVIRLTAAYLLSVRRRTLSQELFDLYYPGHRK